jgi:hypothetical protein
MWFVCGDALNRRDLSLVCMGGQQQAGMNRTAVQQNGACPAFAQAATFFCAGQAQIFTQNIQQNPIGFDFQMIFFSIDGDIDRNAHV